MESCGDCDRSQQAVRVKEEPEHPPSPVDCYLATPIKEETHIARAADCLDETQYVKEEALCVDSEEQEASCSETVGSASSAAMLAGLYADHTIKDELVLGPEVLHRPNVIPVFRGCPLAVVPARPQEPRGGARLASDCSVRLERLPPRPAPPALLSTHEQEIHTPDDKKTELICDLCGEKFGLKSDLLRHAVVHIYTPTSAERGQAGRGAGHSESVVVVARDAVSEARRGRCSVRLERLLVDAARRSCRLGRRTYRLRTEPAPAHTARCDHCGEAFPNKSLLVKHLRTHLPLELTRSGYSDREESKGGNTLLTRDATR